jgi:hypothetical protein
MLRMNMGWDSKWRSMADHTVRVMAGLVPAIHVLLAEVTGKTWMPGVKPGMTAERSFGT